MMALASDRVWFDHHQKKKKKHHRMLHFASQAHLAPPSTAIDRAKSSASLSSSHSQATPEWASPMQTFRAYLTQLTPGESRKRSTFASIFGGGGGAAPVDQPIAKRKRRTGTRPPPNMASKSSKSNPPVDLAGARSQHLAGAINDDKPQQQQQQQQPNEDHDDHDDNDSQDSRYISFPAIADEDSGDKQ